MKKRFRKLRKKLLRPLVLITIVLLAVVLVGGYFLIFAGGDDSNKTASTTPRAATTPTGPGSQGRLKKPKAPKLAPEQPSGKEFTIDSDRAEGDYATATASGAIKTPARIRVLIGAAPKQPVTVNPNIVCLLPTEGAKSNADTFSVTPPATRELKLPVANAVSCTATAGVQLTQAGKGRIKVFLTGTRRAGG